MKREEATANDGENGFDFRAVHDSAFDYCDPNCFWNRLTFGSTSLDY